MDYVTREITLVGAWDMGVPSDIAGRLLQRVVPAARASALMTIQGRGKATGRPARWVADVSDIHFVEATREADDMLFRFAVPPLGSAAEHLYRQRDFWRAPPRQDATAIDLLALAIEDVSSRVDESEHIDADVLNEIYRFRPIVAHPGCRILLPAQPDIHPDGVPTINSEIVVTAAEMMRLTPSPQRTRVIGKLDMIRDSTRRFGIALDDGTELAGFYEPGSMSDLQPIFMQRVLATGEIVYRSNGRPLRIDADRVIASEDESTLWSRLPPAPDRELGKASLHKTQGPNSGLAALLGKWPGSESDTEIEAALSRAS
jgi:hypothetical protein